MNPIVEDLLDSMIQETVVPSLRAEVLRLLSSGGVDASSQPFSAVKAAMHVALHSQAEQLAPFTAWQKEAIKNLKNF